MRLTSEQLSVKARLQPRDSKGRFTSSQLWGRDEREAYQRAREANWKNILFAFEVAFWNSYKEKRKNRTMRYEVRTTVFASDAQDAKIKALKNIAQKTPADMAWLFDGRIDLFANDGENKVSDDEVDGRVRYFKLQPGERAGEPDYNWK